VATVVGDAARATRKWAKGRADRRAVAKFAEFWQALQQVGDALAEAQKEAKRADDPKWRARGQRHWDLATVQEIRGALRRSKFSLQVVSNQAKAFEPKLIVKDWRR
jgi:hypothetical protein